MNYEFSSSNKKISFALMAVGILAVVYAIVMHIPGQRIWANVLVNSYYFLGVSLIGTFFVALQYVAQAGWSAGLKRVPEAIGQFVPFAGILAFLAAFGSSHSLEWNHLYHWMDPQLTDPNSDHYDTIIAGKSAYLNEGFFYIRLFVYVAVWTMFTFLFRKISLREDAEGGLVSHKKNITYGAIFIVFYAVTSSTSSWDFMLSLDPHWFSTLFGWYNFATFWVAGLSMIALIIIHLKKHGHFQHVNENHLHDLGKFMFAFSIFWTYLWFSQFMLIWYADIPEEVTYYIDRYTNYAVPFFSLIVINFAFPILLMMSRDAKRSFKVVRLAAVVIIFGHWLDVFIMVMPGTVKADWGMGFLELGMLAGFVGAFMFVVLNALSKAALVPKNHPFLEESEHHHVM
ncbi:MAG: hypothetical protein ACI9P8_001104 [Bacteroidia bacterium]|jgi:hypothetical protein